MLSTQPAFLFLDQRYLARYREVTDKHLAVVRRITRADVNTSPIDFAVSSCHQRLVLRIRLDGVWRHGQYPNRRVDNYLVQFSDNDMPAEQLESFLDNPAMREAVSVIFERSNEGSEELQWADVEDALSSGQWGRLIETGILVSGGTGFTFANPERVEQTLAEHGHLTDTTEGGAEIESESWAWYDKAAGVAALALFAGYWNTGIRDMIASFDNVLLAPVTDALPFYAVIIILAIVTGLYSTVLQSRLMDHEKMQAYQERMNDLKERKEAAKERGDDEALERIQEEQMEQAGDQLGMFKLQFRPMVWIMLITIPVFLWLRWKVRGGHLGVGETGLIVPLAGAVSWQEPLLGPMSTWIVWYFLCSMASRQIIQKTLNIQTSPSSSS